MPRGWLTFPLGRGFRLGISGSRTWLSMPIFGTGIRYGLSLPLRRRRSDTVKIKEIGRPKPTEPQTGKGRMPGALADDR
jgi:hypothetical protein